MKNIVPTKKVDTVSDTKNLEDKANQLEQQLKADSVAVDSITDPEITKPKVKALTSEAVNNINNNVVTDKKVDTSEEIVNLNEFMRTATAEDLEKLNSNIDWSKIDDNDIFNEAIIAIDIKLPSHLDVKAKDPSIMLRWVNRKYNGEGGNRYEQMVGMGFRKAEPGDCLDRNFSNKVNLQDGGIICNDLILMKIPKLLLLGMYKANYLKSNRMFNDQNVHNEAKKAAINEFRSGVSNTASKGKVGFFVPKDVPSMADDLDMGTR